MSLAGLFMRIFLALSLGSSSPSFCSCAKYDSDQAQIEANLNTAVVVFAGRVERLVERSTEAVAECEAGAPEGSARFCRQTEVHFRVLRAWRGVQTRDFVVTTRRSSSCKYDFEIGKRYLVYGGDDVTRLAGAPTVSWCSRTRLLRDARRDEALLGAPSYLPRSDA